MKPRRELLKARQKLGKYRIERRLANGGFAVVYQAMDTIEGIRVALKVPHPQIIDDDVLQDFRSEVRMTARLDHPNILPLKDASFIDDRFVIVFPLGQKTLADRLTSRISLPTALDYAEQMIQGVAYAHRSRIVHCDIKPENFIIFAGNRLRLTDFGISKIAQETIRASGTGTVGYMAPEQAMGKPSLRSDVFSLGLILYRMLSGEWPEWPFAWPPPGYARLRAHTHPDLIQVLRRSISLDPRKRYRDANQMLEAFLPAKARALRHFQLLRRRRRK
ncbi:MAG: serine/threonine-protein kinase [Planctomycetales bacterium]